jgi:hypothetical protein
LKTLPFSGALPHLFELSRRQGVEQEPRNVRGWNEMSCYAYELASCNTLELTAEECADDVNEKLVLVVQVEPSFLFLSIAEINFEARVFGKTSERFLGDHGSHSSKALREVCFTDSLDFTWANLILGTWS